MCGYSSCHPVKDGHINVHLVPHSHDDVGWVKTIDQYYYGVHMRESNAGVQYIYDSVLNSLKRHEDRRFIAVETAYFWKWWSEQDDITRQDFTALVNAGRLEFTGGGWSMNDEATTNYQPIIDQMSWGLRRLNDTFGKCGQPKMGWQIDPFGHSNEMASIFASIGFDGLILGRIDYQDRSARMATKAMDMVWRGSASGGESSDIFTSVLYNMYDAPPGFCFDLFCDDQPIVDNEKSPEYNVETKALEFTQYIDTAILGYSSNNLLIPMGNDFAYQDAELWYKNMDRLIRHINNNTFGNNRKYNLMYSTPSCYVNAVHDETNGAIKSKLKTDDFFPYASNSRSYWTGYFTSRPSLKRFERLGNNFLQVCKQLSALSDTNKSNELNTFREAMGVLQHHDAVSGTETQAVASDYARLLYEGIANGQQVTNEAIKKLSRAADQNFSMCLLANISQCELSELGTNLIVTVYNPLSRPVSKYVRLPVLGTAYNVKDSYGSNVKTQIVPIPSRVLDIVGRESNATLELLFLAKDVPPLGFRSYYVEKVVGEDRVTPESTGINSFKNGKIMIEFDPDKYGFFGRISIANTSLDINQTFLAYEGSTERSDGVSGAYLFNPRSGVPDEIVLSTHTKIYEGELVTEIQQMFNTWVGQVIKLYNDENFVEFDWIIGPLPTYYAEGREVISRYSTNLDSDSTFYTDSNGRETLKRIRNRRPTWNLTTILEPPGPNYYPVSSKIVLKDEKRNIQLAVLTDRAQGGSSLADGQVELMVHRSAFVDDELGVNEALKEYAYNQPLVVRGSHYLSLGKIRTASSIEQPSTVIERDVAQRKLLDSWVFLSSLGAYDFEEYRNKFEMEFSGLLHALPLNVHVLTLEPWSDSSLLLRLEHTFAQDEDPQFSQAVTVRLKDLFSIFDIRSVKETMLGGNQWADDSERLKFKASDAKYPENDASRQISLDDDLNVTLYPMQIRTFILYVKY
ncbi:lysosomal alpha-mannosidase-like [Cylas formicarius]|uniref:lysosomal alpha-mannosidase-like n=1 Tax=Cylas formicarius TaxID=197179 RepID=UPI0029587897|nr:lysosomal alpha-mannosidase-like [Cylas formicarius]